MPDTVTFRGAHIRYFDVRLQEAAAFVRFHMSAEFTDPVCEAMQWVDPGESVTAANLEGELLATHLILTPNDKQLRNHEIQFDINDVSAFKVVTIEEDSSKRTELRFVVRTPAEGVAAMLDDYLRRVGSHEGACKVSYTKQEELPMGDKPSTGDEAVIDSRTLRNIEEAMRIARGPASRGIDQALKEDRESSCTSCKAGIELLADGKHKNGMDCTAEPENATLASARQAAGGTHAKRKSGGPQVQ